jgi:hypothetical protein
MWICLTLFTVALHLALRMGVRAPNGFEIRGRAASSREAPLWGSRPASPTLVSHEMANPAWPGSVADPWPLQAVRPDGLRARTPQKPRGATSAGAPARTGVLREAKRRGLHRVVRRMRECHDGEVRDSFSMY